MNKSIVITAAIFLGIIILAACQPHEAPPDLIKAQREGLNKAKAVEGQLQQQAEEQRRAIDDAEK